MITNDPVLAAMHGARGAVYAACILSLMSNLLTLIGPLFMLQIYDRVLPSRSVPTLVVLFVMVVVLYGFYALVEWLRSRISTRLGNLFEARIGRVALNAMLRQTPAGNASRLELIRNSDTIRNFLSGPGPIAMLDIPWLPFYLVLVFVLHPALGWLSIAGALTMAVLLVLNDRLSLRPARKAAAAASQRQRQLNEAIGNVDSIWAMGMTDAVVERLTQVSSTIGDANRQAFDTMAIFGALTKGMRYLLQSAMLAMGAYLVIEGQLSAGLIIATSILTSRALVPIEQLVSQGKNWAVTVQAWKDLRHALLTSEPIGTLLPVPTRDLVVRQLAAGHGTGGDPIVTGAAFRLVAGDCLAILGRSGSGKSTLGRALVGINAPMQGDIRLDGSELSHYDRDMIGQVIGYLPQQVDLFAGTVMENIARLDPDMAFPGVLRAAQLAGTHDLIAALPDGYQTLVGSQQHDLSAGQRQRIGLARALYKDPFLLVLDEPNANLDAEGDAALAEAIIGAKARGAIVVIIAHRPSAVETANKVLYLQNGRQAAFGNRDEILARITHPRPAIEARMAAGGMRSV